MTPTPEILAAAYELLRTTKPFCGWGLPPSSDLTFKVTRSKSRRAAFIYTKRDITTNEIHISQTHVAHTATLLALLAHEMVHLRDRLRGVSEVGHGARFRRALAQISRIHGFDPNWYG